jgi:GAF domain-containing protein
MKNGAGEVRGVLDIDSDRLAAFDDTDRLYLEQLVALVMQALETPSTRS